MARGAKKKKKKERKQKTNNKNPTLLRRHWNLWLLREKAGRDKLGDWD